MNLIAPICASIALMALSACSNGATEREEPDLAEARTDSAAAALAKALPAGDFSELTLGARVVGPAGPEVEAALSNAAGNFADMRGYVLCPAGLDPCDPETAPAGTVYTYVYVVTPGEDNDASTGSGNGVDSSRVERATAFRITRPALGFTGGVGYAKAEALAAMGERADVVITCDEGELVWTLDNGDGGDQWGNMEPVTFYWQSTLPPAGPTRAFEIRADYNAATGNGPYPAPDAKAANACEQVAPAKV